MYSDSELAPLPADGDVEFLLHLHDGFEEIIIDIDVEDDTAEEVGSDRFDTGVHEHFDIGFADIVSSESGLDVQERPHRPGDTLDAVEVGAVGEELDGHIVATAFGISHICSDHGDPVDQCLLGHLFSEHCAQVAVFEVDYRHGRPIGSRL